MAPAARLVGGSVDWLDFDRQPGQGAGPKSVALDMVRETQLWLERFLAEVSPRQKRREFSLLEVEAVIDGLLALGPAPRPLTVAEMNAYSDYRIGKKPAGLTAEQLEIFRRHKDGPDLKAAEALVNAALQGLGAVEKAIPPYGPAQKQYKFKVTGDSSVFPIDDKGELSQKAVDDWVLTGSLKVIVEAETTGPQEPVEMRFRSTRTINPQSDYDLIEPLKLNVGSSATWEHLPIGEFTVELYRDGWGLTSKRVELKAAQNEVTIRVPTPFDWSGRWDIEYQPQENGPWIKLGIMTWQKADEKAALEFKEKQLGARADPCLFGKVFSSFLADFPWGGGGKMAGFACGPDGRSLEGRYGHTQHFSSWLGGMKGYIRMTLDTDNQGFHGSFIQDFETGNWHAWRGKLLGR